MPPDEADPLVLLTYRMTMVETAIADLKATMEGRFDRLGMVSREVYDEHRKSDREFAEETRQIANSARAWTWGMFGLVAANMVGALYAILRTVGK